MRPRAHKPLISFIGKRIWPSALAPAHPHPAAPPEHRKAFGIPKAWEVPARFKHHKLQQFEIDVIQSGGASSL